MTSKISLTLPLILSSPKIKGLLNGDLAVGFSKISLYDLNNSIKKLDLTGHLQPIESFGLLSNGYLVSTSLKENCIKVWDLIQYDPIKIFPYSTRYFAVLNNDDLVIAQNTELRVLDYSSTNVKQSLVGHRDVINCVIVLENDLVASGSNDKTVKVWNSKNGSLIQSLESHASSVYTLAMLQNGNLVSGSADRTIKIWQKNSWELVKTLTGHTLSVLGLTVLKNGGLVSYSDDKTIKLWDLQSGTFILSQRLNTIFGIDALIDGNLAVAAYNEVSIWSVNF